MITAIFEDPARLMGVIISSETTSVSGLFDEFRAEFGFPSPVEDECDEYGPCGPGEVTEAHVRATAKARFRVLEDLNIEDAGQTVCGLFLTWLKVRSTGMVVEDRVRSYAAPCYFSAMPVELDCGDEVDDGG